MAHTPGPWNACGQGTCQCLQVWGVDHPVAKVLSGEWGDEYPDVRIVGENLDHKVEPFVNLIAYGSIAEETAADNARLIAAAPDLLEALEEIAEGDGCNCRVGPGRDMKCKDIARAAIAKYRRGKP